MDLIHSRDTSRVVIESPVRSGFLPLLALTETLTGYDNLEFSN
jgi:hypothetical protein